MRNFCNQIVDLSTTLRTTFNPGLLFATAYDLRRLLNCAGAGVFKDLGDDRYQFRHTTLVFKVTPALGGYRYNDGPVLTAEGLLQAITVDVRKTLGESVKTLSQRGAKTKPYRLVKTTVVGG